MLLIIYTSEHEICFKQQFALKKTWEASLESLLTILIEMILLYVTFMGV